MDDHNIVIKWAKVVDKDGSMDLCNVSLHTLLSELALKQAHTLRFFKENDPENLKYITRRVGQLVTSCSFLNTLQFSGLKQVCDKGLISIAAELPCKSSLTELVIDGNFTDEGMRCLAQALEDSSIVSLSLWGNYRDQGVKYLSKSIETLSITSLVLHGEYGDQGVKYLCNSIETLSITKLRLHGKYGDQGVQYVCNSLKTSSITDLRLQGDFTDEGVDALLSFISQNQTLQYINFEGGKISQYTCENIFKVLKHNHSIKEIKFSLSNSLETKFLAWLEDCFSENVTIENIYFYEISQSCEWYTNRNKVCNKLQVGKLLRDSIPKNLKGENDMINFITELKNNSEPMHIKLVVLGNGRIGKTTLVNAMHRILNPALHQDVSIKSTVGIDQTIFKIAEGEVAVWDFAGQMEYTATHSFFLSMEMTSILVCFSLALSANEQRQQIIFWLNFLNSSLSLPPLSSSFPKWNIILVGVREDEQHDFLLTQEKSDNISSWKQTWPRLPIATTLFTVSSLKSKESVQKLLVFVEQECTKILAKHAALIPASYHNFLKRLPSLAKDSPLLHWIDLFKMIKSEFNLEKSSFKTMLEYMASIGQIVWLPTGIVFTDPTSVPKIVAKLLKEDTDKVQILDETKVGCLLQINASGNKLLSNELDLIVHLKICFPLHTADTEAIQYLFPSFSSESSKFQFLFSFEQKQVAGVRLQAPHGMVFVRGFLCQFLIAIFTELNIYYDNIQTVCANGAVIKCPGLFDGELIVTIEPSDKSLIIAMNASNPDTEHIVQIFSELIQQKFSQYTVYKQETLCTKCLKMAFLGGSLATSQIGKQSVCTQGHTVAKVVRIPTCLVQTEKCKLHKRKFHDIFLNYRVKCEGTGKGTWECSVVEQVYMALAVKKTKRGKPLFVFWDCKCLNEGQNWEMGFARGITNSQVIVLLMSDTTMEGIKSNAALQQDNVLIEYEFALLLNKLYGVPVLPVFLAEWKEDREKLVPFSFSHSFLDIPHKRNKSSQLFMDNISQTIPDIAKGFLGSIKETMSEIFKLQGFKMLNRTENKTELQELIDKILGLLEISSSTFPRSLFSLLVRFQSSLPLSTTTPALLPPVDQHPLNLPSQPHLPPLLASTYSPAPTSIYSPAPTSIYSPAPISIKLTPTTTLPPPATPILPTTNATSSISTPSLPSLIPQLATFVTTTQSEPRATTPTEMAPGATMMATVHESTKSVETAPEITTLAETVLKSTTLLKTVPESTTLVEAAPESTTHAETAPESTTLAETASKPTTSSATITTVHENFEVATHHGTITTTDSKPPHNHTQTTQTTTKASTQTSSYTLLVVSATLAAAVVLWAILCNR